jgi:glycosyltransferase involved in cell wall biosynthesis
MTASKTGKLIIRKTRIENIKNISTKGIVVITPSTYAYKKISNSLTAKVVIYPNFISSPFPQCFIETQFLLNEYEEKLLKNETNFIPRIISVGTYNSPRDNKGTVLLRSVINNLIDLNINFEIVTIGEYISFKGMCKHMHINRVSPDELMKLYATSDLCLVTSKYETFSQVTMESILCGTPVIAFDVTGPKDIIKKCNLGFLVKGFNAGMYQKKVQSEILFKKNNLKFIESNATKVINYNNINKEQYMNLYL